MRVVMVTQAYRFALDPTPAQERLLRSHAGAARFAWNWALAACRDRYDVEGKWWSGAELHRLWNRVKKADPGLGWWGENSKCVYQEAFRDLERALREFVRSRNGGRKGRRLGFPRFKRRGRCRDSFRFGSGVMRCAGRTVTLPRMGVIATHESTRKLARRIDHGTARILSATVTRTAHRWHVSFTVQVDRRVPQRHARPGSAVGVDLGVTTLLTAVDDHGTVTEIPGPKALRAGLRKLARLGKAHSRTQPGSANRAKAARRLPRHHARVAALRTDALHKATTHLAARYETVVVEDLNVTGMLANRRLARAVADRWFPSSKTCSGCGGRKPSLPLSERTYRCEACGLVLGRDVNAAINLRDLAASGAERQNACGGDVRPGPAGQPPAKQEPGTTPRVDQTGTAAAQATATWTADTHIRSHLR
ncbi:RNA-guided endonuclease TnpB family protein [Actinomadura violacea]|uniref:Transposase n=1 Tax=Actinomadura violacea TaxID=2819934 RepID=A0ABS3S9W0_9ACTN|nr:RNA-guided endonuclease TnpB family protein [Actinomadura violacea]MBO2465792.1 transposase [Actinomadura violacea]